MTHAQSLKELSIEYMIGLETHVQLDLNTKLFCSCMNVSSLDEDFPPNTAVCDVCLGMPGTKPVLNERAIEFAVKAALALNCKINNVSYFSRKTYFYPDLAKNYQITQYEIPIAEQGWVMINVEGKEKKIRIKRIHIEEDPAKIIHKKDYSLIDYNRSGTALIEIVTEPDISTPQEARAYLDKLMQILEYIDVYDSSKFTFKSDANISIKGSERVEIKNITGIKEVEQALHYESIRQKNLYVRGRAIERETRKWDESRNVTVSLRTKESEEDYGYIFEPDLPYIDIDDTYIESIRASIPELPDEKLARFIQEYGINRKLAESLVSEKEVADLFEYVVSKGISIKNASTWVGVVLKKVLNYNGLLYRTSRLKDEWIYDLISLYEQGKYNDLTTEHILRKMVEDVLSPKEVITKYGFKEMVKDSASLEEIAKKVIAKNQKAVEDYKQGNKKAIFFLVGMLMRETKGAADPNTAREVLEKLLGN